MTFDPGIFIDALLTPALLQGAGIAMILSILVFAVSFVACLPVALWLKSKSYGLKGLALVYVWIFRAAPVILVLLIVWNGTPQLIPLLLKSSWFTPFLAAALAFMLVSVAYMAEIMKSALSSVSPGQAEAAWALGLTKLQAFLLVVLPQALKIALPPLMNEFINLLKATSLAYVISLREIMAVTNDSIAVSFRFVEWYCAALTYYLVIVSVFMALQSLVAKKLK